MGLDATVYCNCFESNCLLVMPDPKWAVYVTDEGIRSTDIHDLETLLRFDEWDRSLACKYEWGQFVSHRLGNIGTIAWLRDTLQPLRRNTPVLFDKVIYSGSHAGDYLDLDAAETLRSEMKIVTNVAVDEAHEEAILRAFESSLNELIHASLKLRKPISF